jgi:hypothetical protein
MFSVDTRVRYIVAQRANVVSLYASLNKPHIGVPGKTAQEVQAFICGVRNPAGNFAIYVTLHLASTRELVHYTDSDRPEVAAAEYRDTEADAVAFVESMGFMLDNLNFRNLPPEQQDEMLKTLPPFLPDTRNPPRGGAEKSEAADASSPAVKLARLLAAF